MKSPVLTKAGLQVGLRERWNITGILTAADVATLNTLIALTEDAFALDHQDLKLLANDGATVLRSMSGLDPLGGNVVVDGVSFPVSGEHEAEYTTYRHFSVAVEGTYGTGTGDVLVEFFEKVSIRGTGGARFVHLQPLSGQPVKQTVADATVQRITQSGRAVGLYSWPAPPGPLWPDANKEDEAQIEYDDPERRGGLTPIWVNWPVSWSYQMEANVPLGGTPNLWT